MITSCKLPLSFDAAKLRADLKAIAPDDWVRHFNQTYYEGEWKGIAMRSVAGDPAQLYPDPHAEGRVEDTPILKRCPNIRDVLEVFRCPIRSARLLKLDAGSRIREHRDYNLGFADGEVRLHIPVTTDANVDFFLAGHKIEMSEGECWYLDFSLPHRVENRSSSDRIHLVIDCAVNDWLLLRFPSDVATEGSQQSAAVSNSESSPEELERFRRAVLKDTKLQQQLRVTDDGQAFANLVVELAGERGYRFSVSDVKNAMLLARRAWFERWID